MATMIEFSYAQLAACARREVKMRRRVYTHRIETHLMSPETAQREIEMMEAIAEHFDQLATEKERLL
jgi:hypothetical protein